MEANFNADLSYDGTGPIGDVVSGLSPEEKRQQDEALMRELEEVEKEITTLKTVLSTKVKRANEIKRKLGITVWSEMRETAKTGLTDIKGTNAYRNTVQVAHVAKEKTSGALQSAKEKLANVTASNSFRSFGDRFGSAYSAVKDKLKGQAGASASADGDVSLDAAISADKQNRQSVAGDANK